MSRDFQRKVWSLIDEAYENPSAEANRAGGEKLATELNLLDIGSLYGAAIDLLEGHSIGHSQRVAYIAQELAVGLELGAVEITDLTLAALFHDLGLFSITHELSELTSAPESELIANHPLGDVEELSSGIRKGSLQQFSELLIQHAVKGGELADSLPLPDTVGRLISGHHEQYDGQGYPLGLRGDDIPIMQRILVAADCLETAIAGAGERGHSPEFVRAESLKYSGTKIDPALARALVEATQNVRFWGVFTGGGLNQQLLSRIDQERLGISYEDIARFIMLLVELVDAKSPFRAAHSRRVARTTWLMALELGLAEDLAASLAMAAMTHDLGKAGVSNQILDKPKWLTGPEYEQAKKHIAYTEKILSFTGGLFDEIIGWIQHHHERLDGSGYPNRLKGDQLGREVRILATADVYDALISDRPYRKGLDPVAAVRFMEGKVNRYFDPEILGGLSAVVEKNAG